MARVYTPPYRTTEAKGYPRLFLAGSIEMGKAANWQQTVLDEIEREVNRLSTSSPSIREKIICVFNPRRADWDPTWEQEYTNPHFAQQVNWELDNLQFADSILFYFDPKTKSPISLMELGMMIGSYKDVRVVCPDGFYRKGNVDIFCERERIPQFKGIREAVQDYIKNLI